MDRRGSSLPKDGMNIYLTFQAILLLCYSKQRYQRPLRLGEGVGGIGSSRTSLTSPTVVTEMTPLWPSRIGGGHCKAFNSVPRYTMAMTETRMGIGS